MARSAEALCGLLGSAAGSGQQVDIWKSVQSLTLDVVGTVAFGVDFNTLASAEANGQAADGKPAAAAQSATAAGKAGGRARSLRSASTDALLSAVRTVFEVCGPAQPLFGLCFIFPEVRDRCCLVHTCCCARVAIHSPCDLTCAAILFEGGPPGRVWRVCMDAQGLPKGMACAMQSCAATQHLGPCPAVLPSSPCRRSRSFAGSSTAGPTRSSDGWVGCS